jgi:uncharacterized membrane protein SirB2
MSYEALKMIHVCAVALSFCGFAARGIGVLREASWVRRRLVRTLPHVIDTVLLASALGMLWVVRLPPWATPWLRAKVVGLVIYIALGMVALRPARTARAGRPRRTRLLAWIGALAVFGYIVSVAVTKRPLGPLVWLRDAVPGGFHHDSL